MKSSSLPPSAAGSSAAPTTKPLGEVIQIDQALVQQHLNEVRSTVEETLNQMLDAEADRLFRAKRYEHSPERVDTRAVRYERQRSFDQNGDDYELSIETSDQNRHHYDIVGRERPSEA